MNYTKTRNMLSTDPTFCTWSCIPQSHGQIRSRLRHVLLIQTFEEIPDSPSVEVLPSVSSFTGSSCMSHGIEGRTVGIGMLPCDHLRPPFSRPLYGRGSSDTAPPENKENAHHINLTNSCNKYLYSAFLLNNWKRTVTHIYTHIDIFV